MTINSIQNERFHFLDSLRGIASLLILFHHSVTENIVTVLSNFGFKSLGGGAIFIYSIRCRIVFCIEWYCINQALFEEI
jgi:hypothetical protein